MKNEIIMNVYSDSFFDLNYVNSYKEIKSDVKKEIKDIIEFNIDLRKYKINKILKEIEVLLKNNNNILDIIFQLENYIIEINKKYFYSNDFLYDVLKLYIFNDVSVIE